MKIKDLKIALDVDGVLADFSHRIIEHANEIGEGDNFPKTAADVASWNMCKRFRPVFNSVCNKDSFWDSVKPLGNYPDFVPEAYITARPVNSAVTQRWLVEHQFPKRPVFTVNHPTEKLAILKDLGIDIFIDDYFDTIKMINAEGGKTKGILFGAPYQRGHQVEIDGMPTINRLAMIDILDTYRGYFV